MKFKLSATVILLIVSLGTINAQGAKDFSTTYYEGENYTNKSSDCTVGTANFPYVGSGYLDMGGNESFVEWNNIYSETAGNHTLLIKYANASGANRQCELTVNGVVIKDMMFPSHFGDWHYYWIGRVTVHLNAGYNTIRLKANTSSGGPNIDNIAVSSDDGLCSATGTQYNVKDYGAKGDGITNDTKAIQAAIDACSDGGSVVLSEGTFMSGQIKLKSNMTLWIDHTAVLKGIQDNSLYPAITQHADNANVWLEGVLGGGGWELKEAFVYAEEAHNLTIAGGGVIDGNGDCAIWDHTKDEILRPMALYVAYSENVRVANVDIVNSAMWDFVILECDVVIVDGININTSTFGVNKDGIDICDTRDITITNSTILCQDDAICPKSGSTRGINNMTIQNVTVNGTTGNKIKFGTLTYGAFTNCLLQDIAINGSGRGGLCAISLQGLDGADFSNITFDRINLHTSANAFFLLHSAGKRGHRPAGAPAKTGSMTGITFSNLDFRNIYDNIGSCISGINADGTIYKVNDVTFNNVSVNSFKGGATMIPGRPGEYMGNYPEFNVFGMLPAWGYYIRYAENINFENCSQTVSPADVRQPIVIEEDVPTQSPYNGVIAIPGTVQIENYDKGGEGVAYHDADVSNRTGEYRLDGVDIEACDEGGYNIDWSVTGEWLEYTVDVSTSGTYEMTARVASPVGGSFHIEMDGTDISGIQTVPNTGGWQAWQNVTVNVNLSAGQHIMRFYIDSQEFNTNYISFSIAEDVTALSVTPTSDIGLYPNPITNELFVTGVSVDANLIVYSMSGTKLLQTKGQSITIKNIPNGMFLIKIQDHKISKSLKFIKA
ncbi:carbohydrate-binding protein [Plebeiibacterium marinum]|uniref:Carbohydrate-binding protein n=1 Tax=Plebeiibacterium marinum TaxID=2992111 RepID=A0AAE3SJ16_9BACT|nr:carbohydrate-binding protein [Plebeiobacterium marinum]MCW3804938.1 carbohydrate-binding protein [Plebeiobacterium marinum]